MDRPSPKDALRSRIMRSVKRIHTGPEMLVRSILHSMGFRFRIARKDLPGSPDIVLPKWKAVIYVHGCFWHRHEHCRLATVPKHNRQFWESKFLQNIARDKDNIKQIRALGWRACVIWQCELKNGARAAVRRIADQITGREAVGHYMINEANPMTDQLHQMAAEASVSYDCTPRAKPKQSDAGREPKPGSVR